MTAEAGATVGETVAEGTPPFTVLPPDTDFGVPGFLFLPHRHLRFPAINWSGSRMSGCDPLLGVS
jgi:hypothetical protein